MLVWEPNRFSLSVSTASSIPSSAPPREACFWGISKRAAILVFLTRLLQAVKMLEVSVLETDGTVRPLLVFERARA